MSAPLGAIHMGRTETPTMDSPTAHVSGLPTVSASAQTTTTTEPRQLRPYQIEAVTEVEAKWEKGYERTSVVLPTGSGKPLSDDTPIPTPDRGMVRMGDLKVGDTVYGPDGVGTRIVAVDPQGVIDLYEVTTDDGASVLAGEGHLWTVRREGAAAEWQTLTTREMLGLHGPDRPRWVLPLMPAAVADGDDAFVPPEMVAFALILGIDESTAHMVCPSFDQIETFQEFGLTPTRTVTHDDVTAWFVPEFTEALDDYDLLGSPACERRIPEEMLRAPAADRERLLGSLAWLADIRNQVMDAPLTPLGDWAAQIGEQPDLARDVVIPVESAELAEDIAELAWSLGFRAAVATMVGPSPSFAVTLALTDGEHAPQRTIVGITPAGTGPATCIQVDNAHGLFAAGRRYMLTHNSTVIASLAANAAADGKRVLLLAHRGELLGQMAAAVAAVDPTAPEVGIVMGERDDPEPDIVAASFQTLARSPDRVKSLGRRDVILVDECHHAMAETYLGVLVDVGLTLDDPRKGKDKGKDSTAEEDEFGDHPAGYSPAKKVKKSVEDHIVKFDERPPVVACGFTATMHRDDRNRLGEVWNTVAYEKDLLWAIENGYLIAPKGKTVHLPQLDKLASIRTVAGDYNQRALDEVMRASADTTIAAITEHASDRAMIVFAASVEHADLLAESLTASGIKSAAVVGSHSRAEREESYEAFAAGEIQALVTVMVLTEGADFPRCDAVVMARPTRSQVLFSQMVGRSLRLYTDPVTGVEKKDALVLDLTGVARDNKLITLTELWGDAEVERYDDKGDLLPEPEPEPDAPHGAGRERHGRADLEDIDMLRRPVGHHDVLAITSEHGLVLVPTGRGGLGYALWPPNPARANRVYLMQVDPKQGVSLWTDNGVPVYADANSVLDAAKRVAYDSRDPETGKRLAIMRSAGWRGPGRRPSTRQKELAQKLKLNVDGAMSMADVSDMLSAALMERTVVKMLPTINSWNLEL